MEIRPLTKELQEKAIAELNEVPNRIPDDLNHIREWICKQPNLKARLDDQWLVSFLRGCKYSLQRAKEKIEVYYTLRYLTPEFYGDRDLFSPQVHRFFTDRLVAKLPNVADPLVPGRYLLRCRNGDPNLITVLSGLKSIFMLIDTLMYTSDSCLINGQEIIVDFEGSNPHFVKQVTPTLLKKVGTIFLAAYPHRVKGVYVLNLPQYLHIFLNFALSLLPGVIKKRIHLYYKDNIEEFYDRIPRSVLPEEYGGDAGPFNKLSDELRLFAESQRDWLMKDSAFGYVKLKHPEKLKYISEFNVEGSFRKLEVD